jgi:Fur family ferric uptake transcriptional regulator
MAHDEIAIMKLLQSRRLRVTNQRLLILDAVCEGRGHTTLADVLRRLDVAGESIDQSTVYRTLDLMSRLGVIAASVTATGTVYEIVGQDPHHHLMCTACQKQYEVPHDAVRALFDRLFREYGFTVRTQHLMLEGVCGACRTNEENAS